MTARTCPAPPMPAMNDPQLSAAQFSHAIFATGDDATISNAGTISTQGADGLHIDGANATITHTGTISTGGVNSHGIFLNGASPTLAMPSGRISTAFDGAYGITNTNGTDARNVRITLGGPLGNAMMATPIGTDAKGDPNACDPALHACIDTAGLDTYGIALFAYGEADPDGDATTDDNLYTITTRANSRITTTGESAHGIVIGDTPNASDTAQVDLNLGGEIDVSSDVGSVGVFIADATGAVRDFTISGRIQAHAMGTAIQDTGAATTLTCRPGLTLPAPSTWAAAMTASNWRQMPGSLAMLI